MRQKYPSCHALTLSTLIATLVMCGSSHAQLSEADIADLQAQAAAEGWTFEITANPATRYSLEQLCGFSKPKGWEKLAEWDTRPVQRDLPSSFDWRDMGGVTPIKNQASCGSCWAFSTVAPLECAIKIYDGVTVDLSEQWLVRCNRDGWDCAGGFYAHDYHEWKTDNCGDYGAVLEADYPYTATDGSCACPFDHPYTIQNWYYVSGEAAMKQAIMDRGPICVDIYANAALQAYGGGVFTGCESASYTNHAVAVVGWDDNFGSGVWIMRNSWGTGWGEGGYGYIPYGCSNIGDSACYIVYGGAIPRLSFSYPDGIPEMLEPLEDTTFRVFVASDSSTPVPGTGWLHYSFNGGTWTTVPMNVIGTNQYEATFPGGFCDDHYDWYVSAEETGGRRCFDPLGGENDCHRATVAQGRFLEFADDFETNEGWTVSGSATTGNWERADPEGVWYDSIGAYTQPENDHTPTGTLCFVTQAAAGSSPGSYDVDDGQTFLYSPVFDLTGQDAYISYWRWYHISTNLDDTFTVIITNNGTNWVTVENIAERQEWTYVEWKISDYVEPSGHVQVRFTARDLNEGSLVEALIDDFKIERIGCEEFSLTTSVDGDGFVIQAPDQPHYAYNTPVMLGAAPNVGAVFSHWSGDLSGTQNPATVIMDSNKSIVAHFVPEQRFTLTVDSVGNGNVTLDPDQPDYLINSVVELFADPDPGWEFSHWSGDLTGTANPVQVTMDGNKTVVANFGELPPDCPEDLDGNETIDLSDLQILLAAYGTAPGHATWNPDADFNGDDAVDLSDLQQLLSVYGTTCP